MWCIVSCTAKDRAQQGVTCLCQIAVQPGLCRGSSNWRQCSRGGSASAPVKCWLTWTHLQALPVCSLHAAQATGTHLGYEEVLLPAPGKLNACQQRVRHKARSSQEGAGDRDPLVHLQAGCMKRCSSEFAAGSS